MYEQFLMGKLTSVNPMSVLKVRREVGLKGMLIDGCFLKGVYYGELLCVMGRDKYNHIYLTSWAIICVEYKENWKWFLEFHTGDLNLDVGKGLTLILDQHKGMHLLNFFLFNLGLLIYA